MLFVYLCATMNSNKSQQEKKKKKEFMSSRIKSQHEIQEASGYAFEIVCVTLTLCSGTDATNQSILLRQQFVSYIYLTHG